MDAASLALAEGLEPTEPRTYAALSKRRNVPRTTLWNSFLVWPMVVNANPE